MRGLISQPPRDVFWPWDVNSMDVHVTPTHKTDRSRSAHLSSNGGASHPRHIWEPWAVLWRPAARGVGGESCRTTLNLAWMGNQSLLCSATETLVLVFFLIAFITWPVLVIQLGKCKPLYQGFWELSRDGAPVPATGKCRISVTESL